VFEENIWTRQRKWQEAGENCIMRIFIIVLFTRYYLGGQIKEDEMGGVRSTHGRNEKCRNIFCGKSEERDFVLLYIETT
jgi:hypothetical protein